MPQDRWMLQKPIQIYYILDFQYFLFIVYSETVYCCQNFMTPTKPKMPHENSCTILCGYIYNTLKMYLVVELLHHENAVFNSGDVLIVLVKVVASF